MASSPLDISELGRPIIWLSRWSWYGGKATGYCAFTTRDEAIKYAIMQAKGYVDWTAFPDPSKKYPYDDRDGSHVPVLDPVFRATWSSADGGFAEVCRTEVSDKFEAAQYAMRRVEAIFEGLKRVPV